MDHASEPIEVSLAAIQASLNLSIERMKMIEERSKSTDASLNLVGTQLERTTESLGAQVPSTAATAERFTRLPGSLSLVGTAGAAASLPGKGRLLSAHQVFGEMHDPSEASRARHGVVSAHRLVYCKDSTSATQADADQVFDTIPKTCVGDDVNKGKILSATVHQMLYPITVSILHQVFGVYGVVLNLTVVGRLGCCEVLVQYNTREGAAQARAGLQGRCIYDGCCQLDIQGAEQSQLSVLETSSSMQSKQLSVTTTPNQVPKFDGTNMAKWRAGCEEYFTMYKIPRVLWIIAAQMNMIGDAALWLQAHKTKHVIESWEDLCAVMLHAFGPGSDQKLLDSADERHDIDDNKTLSAQSATSQDSVYSQIKVSHMHHPISKKDGGELQVIDIITHVGGLSLFLEFCSDSTDVMTDDNPLKNSGWSTKILEDVVTDVGGMSLFLELGLDSAEEIFAEGSSKDIVWNDDIGDSVLTHVGGLSLFLEQPMNSLEKPEGVADTSIGFGHAASGVQKLYLILPPQEVYSSDLLTLPWDPGNTGDATHDLIFSLTYATTSVKLSLPWNPGKQDVIYIGLNGYIRLGILRAPVKWMTILADSLGQAGGGLVHCLQLTFKSKVTVGQVRCLLPSLCHLIVINRPFDPGTPVFKVFSLRNIMWLRWQNALLVYHWQDTQWSNLKESTNMFSAQIGNDESLYSSEHVACYCRMKSILAIEVTHCLLADCSNSTWFRSIRFPVHYYVPWNLRFFEWTNKYWALLDATIPGATSRSVLVDSWSFLQLTYKWSMVRLPSDQKEAGSPCYFSQQCRLFGFGARQLWDPGALFDISLRASLNLRGRECHILSTSPWAGIA